MLPGKLIGFLNGRRAPLISFGDLIFQSSTRWFSLVTEIHPCLRLGLHKPHSLYYNLSPKDHCRVLCGFPSLDPGSSWSSPTSVSSIVWCLTEEEDNIDSRLFSEIVHMKKVQKQVKILGMYPSLLIAFLCCDKTS